jgi:RNA polymerase-binding protein DksA
MVCCSFDIDAMDLPTQAHLKTLRDLLSYRLAELRADIHAAEQERRDSAASVAPEVGDRKDEAAQRQGSELAAAQEQRDRDEMTQVVAALHRLDTGTYGDCIDCGEPIPLKRLLAQAAAERCAPCQSAREHAAATARGV